MNWLKRNPILAAVLLGCAVAVAAEAWLLQEARQRAARAVANLAQKRQEREWLARQAPAPSEANEQAIAQELAQAGKALAELRAALQPREPAAVAPVAPAKPIDAFFDIAAFVEDTRNLAGKAQVMIKPDERFGFAAHVNEGPEPELVPGVFRQRQAARRLVNALLEARPRVLVTVQRERPQTDAQRAQRNQTGPAAAPAEPAAMAAGGDFFEFNGRSSLRIPGRVESEAFRLEFTGQTPALRAFLNSLANFPVPVVVRRVEVEPLVAENAAATVPAAGAPVPLVAQNLSKFAVIVECVELLAAPERPAP